MPDTSIRHNVFLKVSKTEVTDTPKMIAFVLGSFRKVWWSTRKKRSFGWSLSLIFFSLSSPSAILSVQKKVSPSKCRPLLPTEELTEEKVSIIDDLPTRSFKWLVWLEALKRALYAHQNLLVEIGYGLMHFF